MVGTDLLRFNEGNIFHILHRFQQMQQDVKLHRDWLTSINATADSLRDKIHSGVTHITPLRNDVNQSFATLEEQLHTKRER